MIGLLYLFPFLSTLLSLCSGLNFTYVNYKIFFTEIKSTPGKDIVTVLLGAPTLI